MCGILGTNFLTSNFDSALKHLNNRGPDFNKQVQIEDKLFGHTRLSIIDLHTEANQPMIYDDILIIFNGEIYNYKELIEEENLLCKTASDTEVLIRLYQKYGEDFLNKLNGMFSFCIYDMKKEKIFMCKGSIWKKTIFLLLQRWKIYFFKFYSIYNKNFSFNSLFK